MSSLADILNTSRSALRVQQLAMQVIGQNMANVGTDGYSRRRIELSAAAPSGFSGQWNTGSGVDLQTLGRVRDSLIDDQIRRAGAGLGYWSQRDDALGRVEEIFSELGDNGIGDQLEQFWGAWNDLANNPEAMSSRLALSQKTQTLTASIRSAYSALEDQRATAETQLAQGIDEVNSLTAQIARLNVQIVRVETSVADASDLRDARDKALDRLSQLINISSRENQDGSVGVYTNGQVIVQLDHSVNLVKSNATIAGRTTASISAGLEGRPISIDGGELKALIELRNEDIPAAMADLDTFATTLSTRVNTLHRTGYGLSGTSGQDFFASDVEGAATFFLNAAIVDDPALIAAATAQNAAGDNSLALAIAGVQREKLLNNGRSTVDDFFRDSVLQVGARKARAADQYAIEAGAMDSLQNRRQEVSGVSLDEEMTRLVQVQQAYDAAAKVINAVDEMMQTVLSLGATA